MAREFFKNSTILFLLIPLFCNSCVENTETENHPLLWGKLESGSYNVGFKVMEHPENSNIEVSI